MLQANLYMIGINETKVPKYILVLVYGYLFIYYTRIQDNIPGLAAVPWVGVWFLIVTLWGLSQLRKEHFSSPIAVIFWLGVLFCLTGFGAISPASFKMAFKWIFQVFPQCVALYVVFSKRDSVQNLLKLWVVIYFFMALFTIKNTPYGAGDFTRDPNDACLALAMGIPYVAYSSLLSGLNWKWKRFCHITLVLLFVGVVMTSSRGGFLGMLAGLGAMWWLSGKRLKIAMAALLGGIVIGSVVLSVLPEGYLADMESINDTEDETRLERIHTWEIGWEMFKDKPLLGVGAGNFSNTSHLYEAKTSWWTGFGRSLSGRAAHSLYFQVIPELGIFGIAVYVYFIFLLPLTLIGQARKLKYDNEDERLQKIFLNIILASMAAYCAAGAFISVAYYPHLPMWITMYAIYRKISKEKVTKQDMEGEGEPSTSSQRRVN